MRPYPGTSFFLPAIARIFVALMAIAASVTDTARAQSVDEVQEWAKRIKTADSIGSLGTNLFGDATNYYDGGTVFSITDIDLPGNNALPVRFARILKARAIQDGNAPDLLANWEIELPYISGIFSKQYGWQTNGSNPYARCSGSYQALPVYQSTGRNWQYWRGNYIYMPGAGSHVLLTGYVGPVASDGQTTVLGTSSFTQIRCIAQIANPSSQPGYAGEGFVALTSDGTKYYFDWMTTRFQSTLTSTSNVADMLPRVEVRLYPTKVVDRFGNQVIYTWSGSQLQSIAASDGRSITFTYNSGGYIATATTNSRTWTYNTSAGYLSGVALPDGSAWSFTSLKGSFNMAYDPTQRAPGCDTPGSWYGDLTTVLSFKHPSGATGVFTFSPVRHGRTQVPTQCLAEPGTNFVQYGPPILRDNFALTHKTISGPGISGNLDWSVSYSAPNAGYTNCSPGCPPDTEWVQVANPDGSYSKYTYGIRYYIDEGKLLNAQTFASNGSLMRSQSMSYVLNPSSPPYPAQVGRPGYAHPDAFADTYLTPRAQTVLTQDGDTYTNTVNSFDSFAREVSVSRQNSFGGSRTDVAAYFDDTNRWVLGQVKSTTNSNTGLVSAQTDYDPTADKPAQTYAFGLPLLHFSYNADGTLSTAADGLNHSFALTNWKRGAPQAIGFPDGTSQSAAVDNNGWIGSQTDGRGNVTNYGYDPMGRLINLSYPASDTVAWSPRSIGYAVLSAAELGVPAGSWRARSTEGRMRKSIYYDALWRPVLSEEFDTATGIARYVASNYDYDGRLTFRSFPSSTPTHSTGNVTTYDALGRPTTMSLTDFTVLSTITYLSGNRRQVKDASGNITVTSYQAFDQPTDSRPTSVVAPAGETTTIGRDLFGHILSVTRSGTQGSLIDSYVYDANYRLCKRIEPETGQTVMAYDAASRMTWMAKGQAGSATTCDYASVPASARIAFGYDGMNRETSITYPDASGNIALGYDADGHLTSANNPAASWAYSYNKRGLLESEQASIDGHTYLIDPAYDPQAHLASVTHPDSLIFSYSPDAWGQPSQVVGTCCGNGYPLGTFVNSVQYWPNGTPSSYTLGNGIAVTQGIDTRQRLLNTISKYGSTALQSLSYGYNTDSDLTSMTDGVDGSDSATFGYDGLHRLASASGLWGSYGYSYDVFDNLTTRTGPNALTYTYNTTTNRLSSVTGGAVRAYAYDTLGHTQGDGARSYAWNLADEITSIPGVATYTYDAHGKRIKVTKANGAVEYSIYNLAGRLVYVDQPAVGNHWAYLAIGGKTVAQVTGGVPTYLHADLLGSARLKTDTSRNTVWREHYDPYGTKMNGTSDKLGYTGHAYDAESGLTYAQARFYDAQVGRFLSSDPIAFTEKSLFSFNRYSYGNDSPYAHTDPTGKQTFDGNDGGTPDHLAGEPGGSPLIRVDKMGRTWKVIFDSGSKVSSTAPLADPMRLMFKDGNGVPSPDPSLKFDLGAVVKAAISTPYLTTSASVEIFGWQKELLSPDSEGIFHSQIVAGMSIPLTRMGAGLRFEVSGGTLHEYWNNLASGNISAHGFFSVPGYSTGSEGDVFGRGVGAAIGLGVVGFDGRMSSSDPQTIYQGLSQ